MSNAETIAAALEADRCPAVANYIRKLDKDRSEILDALRFLINAEPADKPMAELAAKIAIERAERE